MASYQNAEQKTNRKPTPTMRTLDDVDDGKTPRASAKRANIPKPLRTNTFGNLQGMRASSKEVSPQPDLENMLNKLRLNDSRKPTPIDAKTTVATSTSHPLDQYTSGSDIRKTSIKKDIDINTESDASSARDVERFSGSELYTPATDVFDESAKAANAEMEQVKRELEAAKSVINQQKRELEDSRTFKHTMEQALPSPSEAEFPRGDVHIGSMQSAFNASARPFSGGNWTARDVHTADLPPGVANNARRGFAADPMNKSGYLAGDNFQQTRGFRAGGPDDNAMLFGSSAGPHDIPRAQAAERTFSSGSFAPMSPTIPNAFSEIYQGGSNAGRAFQYRSNYAPTSNFGAIGNGIGTEPLSGGGQYASLSPDLMQFQMGQSLLNTGRPLTGMMAPSPTTSDFSGTQGLNLGSYAPQAHAQTYVTPLEPMNYRRLLDKSVSCDWKYIVDKIVCNNDQQASIFLQQKLKVGTAEQKFEIVESIINQAYPLMINRFGNFLVQRCFEHSTPDQVIAIADAIHGNVISLSMDPFGCHVIQKAFDSVPENHKADMVRELLRRIPDTVIHRYACHVWQKLFELRWSGESPQIMVKVNDALRGMWHEVALGETGSLVVQNIFENCVEDEKRPAIEEVIANIDLIAHGQFGNWCIQHLCEHSAPPDKRRVIDHILVNAYSYSIDQYASKVVEKCLKIGGIEFLDRYLTVITTSHPDRPRIPLIDIAGDQYGNYLVQWILMNTHQQQREQVAIHIRKHMVSLRGSKFGSRVAMLCCNPASVTRPGPGAMANPYGAPGQPRTQYSRYR
ncbi:hypothetical protein OHC33_007853 [Knufia fluminis]|uniref:PUM-HD domain-containing protein n=1 Tax=Knufia fluminis TaxID=191047 RepID=A0AAN8ECS9_9EURO|nr:hypothetical protein OHC33_007853 [Knufia fluminis]